MEMKILSLRNRSLSKEGADMERLTNSGTKEAKPDVTIGEVLNKLAEYEDFEEIFRSKMTDAACDFLKDKEEFARWLDRNKWITKRCDEYARADKQGKLLKLPCAVGDMVWYISDKTEKQGRKKVSVSFIDKGIVDNITLGQTMIPQITICNDENVWTTFDSIEDFGKTVFLTKEEADTALKEIENEQRFD